MIYILIVLWAGSHNGTSIEFNDLASCQAAEMALKQQPHYRPEYAFCAQKGRAMTQSEHDRAQRELGHKLKERPR